MAVSYLGCPSPTVDTAAVEEEKVLNVHLDQLTLLYLFYVNWNMPYALDQEFGPVLIQCWVCLPSSCLDGLGGGRLYSLCVLVGSCLKDTP